MTEIHPASLRTEALLAACSVQFSRASGPGGQNRNKVETAVILTHAPTGLKAEANERRTQGENRLQALFRLRLRLALEVRCPPRLEPSSLWNSRCRGGKVFCEPNSRGLPLTPGRGTRRTRWPQRRPRGNVGDSGLFDHPVGQALQRRTSRLQSLK